MRNIATFREDLRVSAYFLESFLQRPEFQQYLLRISQKTLQSVMKVAEILEIKPENLENSTIFAQKAEKTQVSRANTALNLQKFARKLRKDSNSSFYPRDFFENQAIFAEKSRKLDFSFADPQENQHFRRKSHCKQLQELMLEFFESLFANIATFPLEIKLLMRIFKESVQKKAGFIVFF